MGQRCPNQHSCARARRNSRITRFYFVRLPHVRAGETVIFGLSNVGQFFANVSNELPSVRAGETGNYIVITLRVLAAPCARGRDATGATSPPQQKSCSPRALAEWLVIPTIIQSQKLLPARTDGNSLEGLAKNGATLPYLHGPDYSAALASACFTRQCVSLWTLILEMVEASHCAVYFR